MQPFKPQSEILANAPHGHEEGDVAVNGVLVFLAVLAACCLLVFVIAYGVRDLCQRYVNYDNASKKYTAGHWQELQQKETDKAVEAEKVAYARAKDKPAPTDEMEIQMQLDQAVQRFPQPRLQTDDAQEMQTMRNQEQNMLQDYMWINQGEKRVTIPIDQAMDKIVAEHTIQTTTDTPAPAGGVEGSR